MRGGVPLTPAEYEVIDAAPGGRSRCPACPADCRYCVKGCPEGVHQQHRTVANIYDQMGDAYRPRRTTAGTPATGRRARASVRRLRKRLPPAYRNREPAGAR